MSADFFVSYKEVESILLKICNEIDDSGFLPDVIVAVNKNSSFPAIMISNYFDIPIVTIDIKNDEGKKESLSLAEDAYYGRKVLVVSDVCSTGNTFESLYDLWDSHLYGLDDSERWYNNTCFSSIHVRDGIEFFIDYKGDDITDDVDVIYPWEEWWL